MEFDVLRSEGIEQTHTRVLHGVGNRQHLDGELSRKKSVLFHSHV